MNSVSRITYVYYDLKHGNAYKLISLQNDNIFIDDISNSNIFIDDELMERFGFRYMIKGCLIEEHSL